MALSGSFTGTTSNPGIVPKIVWSGVQNKDGKYTDVTATLTYSRTDSYRTEGSWSGSITIDGTSVSGKDYFAITYYSNSVAMTATVRVYHEVDGSKTITISAKGSIPGSTLSSTTISQSVTLDQIPVPSEVSATTADIGSESTITISAASSKFTHTLTYRFGNLTGTIATNASGATVLWTIPTAFYGEIPNAPSGWGVITCTTYNGTTAIGASTCEFTAIANKILCAPVVSVSSMDINAESIALTGSSRKIVSGISNLKVSTTAEAKNGATIASISAYCGGLKKTGDNVTFENAESVAVYVIVTDSRGYSTRVDDDSLSLISYITPTIIHSVSRDTPTGDKVTISVRGKWFNGSFGSVTNTLRLRVAYRVDSVAEYGAYSEIPVTKNGNDYTATIQLSGLAYTNAYKFQIRLDDEVYTDAKGYRNAMYALNVPLSKGIPVFDWGENDFNFNVPVTFSAGYIDPTSAVDVEAVDFILEQGTSGMWTYRKWSSGIAEAWGENSLTVATQTAYGNGFYNGSVINHALPSGLFNARPQVVGSVSNTGDAQLYYPVIAVTRAGEINYSIMSTKSNASATVYVSFRLTGRWK